MGAKEKIIINKTFNQIIILCNCIFIIILVKYEQGVLRVTGGARVTDTVKSRLAPAGVSQLHGVLHFLTKIRFHGSMPFYMLSSNP
jgi:hypothetical protein